MNFFKEIILTLLLVLQGQFQGEIGRTPAPDDGPRLSSHAEAYAAYEQAMAEREFWKALHYAGKAYDLASRADLPDRDQARYAAALGNARAETAGYYQARDLFRECADLLEGMNAANAERAYCLLREGEMTGVLGQAEEGLALINEAVEVAGSGPQSREARRVQAIARFLDIVLAEAGSEEREDYLRSQYEKAAALLPELEELLGEDDKHAAYLRALIGRFLFAEGDFRAALDHLVPAYDVISQYPSMGGYDWILLEEIKTAARWRVASRYDDALYVLHDGCATLPRNGMTTVCIERSWYPPIPAPAMEQGQYGFAELSYDIDADGKPLNVRVLRSWPEDYYGDEAARYLRAWTFRPPVTEDGETVSVTGLTEFFTFDPERVDYEG